MNMCVEGCVKSVYLDAILVDHIFVYLLMFVLHVL